MKRITCCTFSLIIILLLAGCIEIKQQTNTDAVVITHVTTTTEMTAAPTPRNSDADNVIPTLAPRIFDVDNVDMQPTPDSTCFSEIGYDSDWEILVVRFRNNGSVYTYLDFPEGEWNRFIAADSLGSWYNAHIKGRYEYEIISG